MANEGFWWRLALRAAVRTSVGVDDCVLAKLPLAYCPEGELSLNDGRCVSE